MTSPSINTRYIINLSQPYATASHHTYQQYVSKDRGKCFGSHFTGNWLLEMLPGIPRGGVECSSDVIMQKQNQKIIEALSTTEDEAAQIDRIAEIRGWFRPKDDSVYYPTIQTCVAEQIDTNEAVATLFGPIDEKITAQELDDVDFEASDAVQCDRDVANSAA
jgi:hypothetical protein